MGRKIPGKKHRTVKDPDKQKARRYNEIKDKINNPPTKLDYQEVPKSVLKIMELKERAKNFKPSKRNRSKKPIFDLKKALGKEVILPGMERPTKNQLSLIEQKPNENVFHFTKRVDRMCNEILKEAQFEEKYGVEVKRDEIGRVTEVLQKKPPKRSKKPKLSEKRKNREKKKEEEREIPKDFAKAERVEFGDIVHQPPSNLRIPQKKEKEIRDPKRKPGKKDLFLTSILKTDPVAKETELGSEPLRKKEKIKLTPIEKQRLEARRLRVVEAFRALKKR